MKTDFYYSCDYIKIVKIVWHPDKKWVTNKIELGTSATYF